MENFKQSLKPLTLSMKFFIGLNLDKPKTSTIKKSIFIRFFVPAFGFFVIICHLAINGPCGLYSFSRKHRIKSAIWEDHNNISPKKPFDFFLLFSDICRFPLFFSCPIIHFVFIIGTLLTKSLQKLWQTLRRINFEMKLSQDFHGILRRHCLMALALHFLVIFLPFPSSKKMPSIYSLLTVQDFAAFGWKYYGSRKSDYHFSFSEWKWIWSINSNDFICGTDWKTGMYRVNLGNFHNFISQYPLSLIAALFSRLAEIGIRTTFIVMAATASLLFEELNQRMENLAQKSNNHCDVVIDDQLVSKDLDEWKANYNLVIQLTSQINRFFGPILFITYASDYVIAILEFQNIMNSIGLNPRYYLQFIHIMLRFLSIIIVSQRLKNKVTIIQFYNLKCGEYRVFYLIFRHLI